MKISALTILAVLCLACLACAPKLPSSRLAAHETEKLLIKHGWDMPTVEWAVAHADELEAAPFHGVMLDSPLRDLVFQKERVTQEQAAAALAPYRRAGMGHGRYDFLLIFANHPRSALNPPGVFSDWSPVFDNLRMVAEAARDAGFYGLAFDDEPYFFNWLGWRECGTSCELFEHYAQKYKERGRELMQTLEAAWPGCRLLVFLGPWVSGDDSGDYRRDWLPFAGPFVAGMASARRTVELHEGGELFGLTDADDYRRAAERLRFEHPQRWPFMDDTERTAWARDMRQAFAVYDRAFLADNSGGEALGIFELERKLSGALEAADRIVWFYTEAYDWWNDDNRNSPQPAPREIRETLMRVRSRMDEEKK